LIIAAATAMVASILALFGVQSVQRIRTVEDRWGIYSQDAAEAGRLLHDVSQQMGYGGYIHNFKNFILRRDMEYITALERNSKGLYANLDALESHAISEEEKAAVAAIRQVIDRYVAGIPTAVEAFRRGLSSVEVDILVKVDDQPAMAAIAELNHSILTRTRLAEREISKTMKAAESMVWVLLAVVPVVALLGVMLILFLRRIMDANANLAEVRDELAMLLRQAPDAILHVASDGRILRANDRALALFGYARDELLHKYVEDLIPNRYRTDHVGIRENAFGNMSSRPIGDGAALFAKTKDGMEVPVEISLNFSMSGGKRIATAIVRDVTERKRAESELKQAHNELEQRVKQRTIELEQRTQELEAEINERMHTESLLVQSAKMATIGEMASGITHELNQPMNIIRMGVEAAQISIERGQADMDMVRGTLHKVEGQILRMSDIINHMRVYSRQDTEGQFPFNPYTAVQEGCKLFDGQLAGINVDLDLDIPKHAQGRVLGHTTRLEQVMLNLLSNARDAVLSHQEHDDENHRGWILVSMMEMSKSQILKITVEDNGCGIPDDVLPHIFAPFVTTKESGRGTGLGLSISYGIIEGMGGTIEATNTEDGACFVISLPLAELSERDDDHVTKGEAPVQDVVPAKADDVARVQPAKVLVVDDEVGAAHGLSDFLQDIGYLVYIAYNGEEAMQIFESDPVDIIITDLRMPVMNGEDLIRTLRDDAQTLPIFAMTGHDLVGEEESLLAKDVTEVWRKPLSLSEVGQRLRAACNPTVAKM